MTVALLACRGAVHADAPVKVRHTQASARRTSSRLKDSPLTATAAIATGKRNARTTPLASHGLPLLADGPLAPEWVGPQKARRPAHGPVSPVAPRRTAVAAVVRPADHGLPYVASLMSGVSYGACLRREYDEVKRCRRMLRWASRDLTDPCRFGRHRTQRPKQESPYAGIVGAPGWNRTSDTRFRNPAPTTTIDITEAKWATGRATGSEPTHPASPATVSGQVSDGEGCGILRVAGSRRR